MVQELYGTNFWIWAFLKTWGFHMQYTHLNIYTHLYRTIINVQIKQNLSNQIASHKEADGFIGKFYQTSEKKFMVFFHKFFLNRIVGNTSKFILWDQYYPDTKIKEITGKPQTNTTYKFIYTNPQK